MERSRVSREEGPRYVLQQGGLKMSDVSEAGERLSIRPISSGLKCFSGL